MLSNNDLFRKGGNMKEIEVGDYVRTNKGNIGKVVEVRLGLNKDTELYQKIYMLDNGLWTILDYILKYSKQLIDLIEVGDYVNGKEVIEIKKINEKIYLMTDYCPQNYIKTDIKTILTKESYMANCYKVGVEDE